MGITIGRVCQGGKVHMHIDGRGHGGRGRTRITEVIPSDMLQWIRPADLCKVCFSAKRTGRVSRFNSFSDTRWNHDLDMFLARVGAVAPAAGGTSPERLEQIRRELAEQFRSAQITHTYGGGC